MGSGVLLATSTAVIPQDCVASSARLGYPCQILLFDAENPLCPELTYCPQKECLPI